MMEALQDLSAFPAETGEQTEVGVKYQPLGTKSLFTIAAFESTQRSASSNASRCVVSR